MTPEVALHTDCMLGAVIGILLAFAAGYRIGQRTVWRDEDNE